MIFYINYFIIKHFRMDNKGFEYDLGGDTNGYRVTEKYDQEPLTCLVITGQ